MIQERLFIITNRLPVYFTDSGHAKATSGGLGASVLAYLDTKDQHSGRFKETCWVGIPGCSPETWARASYNIDSPYNLIPVNVTGKMYHSYYDAFSNRVIWPLFHYFPSHAHYDFNAYDQYEKVNQVFAETILKHVRANDVIWIHDYHLLPLAGMIRKGMPGITIGFFLHIPFPSYEIFRLMPRKWQFQLITGMLGADLVGFQTVDFGTHFLETTRMLLGIDHEKNVIRFDNRLIKTDVFPVSIDFEKFSLAFNRPEVIQISQSLKEALGFRKIILSIGRLNYTKGIYNRIKAYEKFLIEYPAFHNKVVFVLVIIPSIEDGKYSTQKKIIDEAISSINSTIGNLGWQPVTYQQTSLTFNKAVGLYSASNVALITPLRDGMNLISKEFIASRKDGKGVLVLSELAGAARELTGALLTNPNDFHETAEQIKTALEMSDDEQEQRMKIMQARVREYDVRRWVAAFIESLREIKRSQAAFQVAFFNDYSRREVLDKCKHSKNRLFLLDYDGTLVPFARQPTDATAGEKLLEILKRICSCSYNDVFIISGRSSDWLQQQFGDLPLSLVAEHGAKIKWKGHTWNTEVLSDDEWKQEVIKVMMNYNNRCPGTFIEEKEFSIAWHYRNANAQEGKLRAYELNSELNRCLDHLDVEVMMGNKIVEVRVNGIGKDVAVSKIISKKAHDFILAMGDDRTDEDMFKTLADNENACTIKIGSEASYAKYNLHTQQMAISFLEHVSVLPQTRW